MLGKMVHCVFQIFQENKSEDQHLTPWTRWKNMTKWRRSAESTSTTASAFRRS
uniref:Hedgehog interacting protein n=1 Tax=Molossus molossus TaxID=27622 RepID=A0A7J8I8F7_MOLMO|nr:hedgehog interacting protein [Molossus molossus]